MRGSSFFSIGRGKKNNFTSVVGKLCLVWGSMRIYSNIYIRLLPLLA